MSDSSDDEERKEIELERKPTTFGNKPYDEAYDVSQDLSYEGSGVGESRSRTSRTGNLDMSSTMRSLNHTATGNKQAIKNKPFDEVLDFSGSEASVDTDARRQRTRHSDDFSSSKSKHIPTKHTNIQQENPSGQYSNHDQLTQIIRTSSSNPKQTKRRGAASESKSAVDSMESSDDENAAEDEDDADDIDDENNYDNIDGVYRPETFSHLHVTPDIKDLFQYIIRFEPHEQEMKTTFKCFIPEYIPSIGSIDSFIKVPRPDGKPDDLGLKFLDEPSVEQSDPTVLELQLRAISKRIQSGDVVVRSLDNAFENPMAIDKWINSITELHSSKPLPQVTYRQAYPEIESLLQEWPEPFQEIIEKYPLPSPDLDLSLAEYAKLLCSLLGIPTYDNPIESLHVMFSLYLVIRDSPDFRNDMNMSNTDDGPMSSSIQDGFKLYSSGNTDILDLNVH